MASKKKAPRNRDSSAKKRAKLVTTEGVRDLDFEYEDQREDEVDLRITPNDFRELIVAPSDWTIDSISRQIGRQIDLNPDFQRRGVWSDKAKSRFIESLFLGVPIPQVLLASKKNDPNSFIVLDGKQRLLTVHQFLKGSLDDGTVFKLTDLKRLPDLNGKTWSDLKSDDEWRASFLNQTLRTAVLRGWKKEDILFEIFERLNSGSVKLSSMELRMSLHPGEFLRFLIKWSEGHRNLHELLRLTQPDKRMADVELTLRFLGFKNWGSQYQGNLKLFLDDVTKECNEKFGDVEFKKRIVRDINLMEDAIRRAITIFGMKHVCRKWKSGSFDTPFNRAVFDVQILSLADPRIGGWAEKHADTFKKAFISLCRTDAGFVTSLETTTKSIEAVNKRVVAWFTKLRRVSGLKILPPFTLDATSN